VDLLDFLECLKQRDIRYLKDYTVSSSKKKYRIVIPEHFIAVSLYDSDAGTIDGEYRVFVMGDLDGVVAVIDEERERPKCPICGKRVRKIETHVENAVECKSKYKEYTRLLLELTMRPPRIADEALTPLVYKIEDDIESGE